MTENAMRLAAGEHALTTRPDQEALLTDAGPLPRDRFAPIFEISGHLEQQGELRSAHPKLYARIARMRRSFGVKRVADVILASAALILLLPLLAAVALAIRTTSDGPVLFRQNRTGLDGRPFHIFKFRTLYAEQTDPSGVLQTRPMDPRVTPLGRFLRRWNIDELPQLMNVIKGDMSLVGPRPHVPGMLAGGKPYADLVPHYSVRHCVRPGLTGLAQINGLRGPTEDVFSAKARIDHDLLYVETWSHWLDLWILLRTVKNECFRGRGV